MMQTRRARWRRSLRQAGRIVGVLALALAPAVNAAQAAGDADPPLRLHVPSPDWRDQIIYFLMIDRFDDGDPSNNDQGTGEYDPTDHARFSGGDLRGVARRIDYLRGLGATAVWITPPVANQWWNMRVGYGGYHGYWAEDFSAVDAHFGTLDDYRALSHALHSAGMYLVQDVVTNHTADFIDYGDGWRASEPAHDFRLIADPRGRTAPSQYPFSLNDARDPAHRAAGIYHWTPDISDYADPVQEKTFQMSGLDDLATENPVVRRALRKAYGDWIREVGVDAFRIDTVFYVPQESFVDFLHADDAQAPGILQVAEQTGRTDFHVFGEGFGVDRPYEDEQARKIDGYMRDQEGNPVLPGMINFPLYGSLGDVFARGAATAVLGHRIRSMMEVHEHPHLMPSFIDNHDVGRFLAGGSAAGLKQALLAIMTLPGIPTIYYGTEQGFTQQRQAMFAGGYGAGGRDHFDTDAPLYGFIRRAADLRRAHPLFSRGVPEVLRESQAGAGALAWRMEYQGQVGFVVLNTADETILLDNIDTGLPAGSVLRVAFDIDGEQGARERERIVGIDGRVHLPLPARGGEVWLPTGEIRAVAGGGHTATIEALPDEAFAGDFELSGTAPGVERFELVIDGGLARAQAVAPSADGAWRAVVDTADMVDAGYLHRVVAWDREAGAASAARAFRVARAWTPLAAVDDPAGDDTGPTGDYLHPLDPVWRERSPLDIRQVRVSGSGGALRVELQMADVVQTWNPPNGFDHVAFTLFIGIPAEAGGSTHMPLQNAVLPDGMRWHYRLRAHGWSNALFSWQGAAADSEGTPVAPGARIETDEAAGTVAFVFPAAALGNLRSLSGVQVYVNTWDYDVRYRALAPVPAPFVFGGGDGARDPLLIDDTGVIVLP